MNQLTDPGFELGTSWTYLGDAARSTLVKYEGSYSCLLESTAGIGPFKTNSILKSEVVLVDPGVQYFLSAWFYSYLEPSDPDWWLKIQVEHGGELEDLAVLTSDDLSLFVWTEFDPWKFTAAGSSAVVWITSANLAGPIDRAQWFVDSLYLGKSSMAFTKNIRDKLVLDLTDIDGTGIFTTTLDAVYSEPVPMENVASPAVWLYPSAGGQGELGTLTSRKGDAEQFWTVKLMVRSDDPHADTMNLIDDVRNAVERSDSNLQGLAGVEEATVTGWSEVLTSEDTRKQYGSAEVNVRVAYLYTRGSA